MFLFILVLFWKKYLLRKIVLLFILILFWFISGRTIAFKYFPNGRIITGWFYYKTNEFFLCKKGDDYEKVISQETKLLRLSFWRLHISNKNISKEIFIGPFAWDRAILTLQKIEKLTPADSRL
jgi:hypothetical protein